MLLCSHQTVKQRPRQYVSRKPAKETAGPEFKLSTEISARVEEAMACLQRRRCDANRVEEDGGEDREDEVEQEAVVGFEAEDAGCGAEDGCGEGLEVG